MAGRPTFEIEDGKGEGYRLQVDKEGNLGVVVHDHPPVGEKLISYPFSQWFTDNGKESGSSDLRVNGSTVPVVFWIGSRSDRDVYIKTISIRIADNGATLNEFGNLAALTNGVDFDFASSEIGQVEIQRGMKTNLDVVRVGLSSPQLGDGASAFRADVSGGGADTYLAVIDLAQTFGFPWGVRLKAGSEDKLMFIVNDDLSVGMDGFDIKGFGVQL